MENINDIIKINQKRLQDKKREYNPYNGKGSAVERIKLKIDNENYIMIPKIMGDIEEIAKIIKCGSISKSIEKNGVYILSDVLNSILKLRMEYDFEYWCATCVKIQDKESKNITPFIMRSPQRKLVDIMVKKLQEQLPIRIILLKARQWGGSTVVQIFMAWIQLFHKKRWHSAIIADVEDQSRNIKSMYSRVAKNHPKEILPFKLSNFEGSTKNKIIESRECIIYISSMQNPDSLRSSDIMMAHMSEVGLWKETEGKKPEDLVQSIAGTIPAIPYSVIVMESTAKGIGNYFHKQWSKAVNGESGYTPIFVSWFEIDIYSKRFKTNSQRIEFANTLSEKEKSYFTLGATLENINWYRDKKYTDSYDDWRMGCEFPTTPIEAFQSTGRRAHSPEYINNMRAYCKAPMYIGELFANKPFGKEAIDSSLRFEQCSNGTLHLWALPDDKNNIKRRYIVSMDIGGRHNKADWSVISVIDRYWILDGGVEECIGTYRFHLDQDLAIWKAVQLAKLFNNALLVVEANSLNPKGSDGDHTLTILDEIKGYYDNLYSRTDPQKIIEGYPDKFGFFTSAASKSDIINQMNKRFREFGYIERDVRALDEADYYEIKDNGTFGAVEGEHDDIYMSRAIGLKASQIHEPPYLIKKSNNACDFQSKT